MKPELSSPFLQELTNVSYNSVVRILAMHSYTCSGLPDYCYCLGLKKIEFFNSLHNNSSGILNIQPTLCLFNLFGDINTKYKHEVAFYVIQSRLFVHFSTKSKNLPPKTSSSKFL